MSLRRIIAEGVYKCAAHKWLGLELNWWGGGDKKKTYDVSLIFQKD